MVCGVREYGVLSPVLFAVYVEDIIERLEDSKLGRFIGDLYLGYYVRWQPDYNFGVSVHFAEDDFYLWKGGWIY